MLIVSAPCKKRKISLQESCVYTRGVIATAKVRVLLSSAQKSAQRETKILRHRKKACLKALTLEGERTVA
jgi:hypothetical protein